MSLPILHNPQNFIPFRCETIEPRGFWRGCPVQQEQQEQKEQLDD